jgi:hypothetical protein
MNCVTDCVDGVNHCKSAAVSDPSGNDPASETLTDRAASGGQIESPGAAPAPTTSIGWTPEMFYAGLRVASGVLAVARFARPARSGVSPREREGCPCVGTSTRPARTAQRGSKSLWVNALCCLRAHGMARAFS